MSRAPVPSPRSRRLALRTGAMQPLLPVLGIVVDLMIVIFAVDAELSLQCVMTGIVMLMDLWHMLHYRWSACWRSASTMACDSQVKALYLRFGNSARRAARVVHGRRTRRPPSLERPTRMLRLLHRPGASCGACVAHLVLLHSLLAVGLDLAR